MNQLLAAVGSASAYAGPAYCHLQEIYLDKDFLDVLVRVGDSTGGVLLAHEWSHHIQWLKGHLDWGIRNQFFGGKELQTDCYVALLPRSRRSARRHRRPVRRAWRASR